MSTLLERLQEAENNKANPDEGEGFSEEGITQLEELAPKVNLEVMQEVVAEVEDQKIRTLAQGLSFGFGDEIEGFVKALLSKDVTYEQARDEVRTKIADYQQANKGEALALEVAGAVVPTVVSLFGGPAGWASALRTITTLGSKLSGRSSISQVAHMSGKGGALYSVGKGEEGLVEDLKNAPGGYIAGATIGSVIQGGGQLATEGISRLLSTEFGKKFSAPVRAAMEKMMQKTGLTADEVIAGVQRGELIVENESLRASIKALTATEGEASGIILKNLPKRVLETKRNLLDRMGEATKIDWNKNLKSLYIDADKRLATAESEAYTELFKELNPVVNTKIKTLLMKQMKKLNLNPKDVEHALNEMMNRKGLNNLLKVGKTGKLKGKLQWAKKPTLRDAEYIYRMIRDMGGKAKQTSDKDAGVDFTTMSNEIKALLTASSKKEGDVYFKLTQVRKDAWDRRVGQEAFEYGSRKILAPGQTTDDIQIELARYAEFPGAMEKLQLGIMSAIKHRKDTGLFKNVATEDSNLQNVIAMVFPKHSVDDIIRLSKNATNAKEAMNSIKYNTTTAREQEATKQLFQNTMNASQLKGEGGISKIGVLNMVKNFVLARDRSMSAADAEQLARLVIEKDYKVVQQALIDESKIKPFVAMIDSLIYGTARTTAAGTSKIGGEEVEKSYLSSSGVMDYAGDAVSGTIKRIMQ
jgi:hypothetical protein